MRSESPARVAMRALALALFALGCASGKTIEPDGEGFTRGAMPMPERVLVFEFDVSYGETEREASKLADDVVTGLAGIPIPGVHVRSDTPLDGPALGVDGNFLAVDSGVRDQVHAAVQLQALVNGYFEPVHSFETVGDGEGLDAGLEHTAQQIVREVARFYASQGWLDPAQVPK